MIYFWFDYFENQILIISIIILISDCAASIFDSMEETEEEDGDDNSDWCVNKILLNYLFLF